MCFRFDARGRTVAGTLALVALGMAPLAATAESREQREVAGDSAVLRVCADPNNLPFSDRAGQGFENRIASLMARALHERLEYVWWAQRRGFARNTLLAGRCDVVMGTLAGGPRLRTTRPYYRSTYVFVTRRSRDSPIASFDDPRLEHLRIGVHVIGDDYNALPPALALTRRGLQRNLVGYSIYGDYAKESPPADLIRAVDRGDVDVAVAWGPLAAYYAARAATPLRITTVRPSRTDAAIPETYDIVMAVRQPDSALAARLDSALGRHRAQIRAVLRDYHVPLVDDTRVAERTEACRRPERDGSCG